MGQMAQLGQTAQMRRTTNPKVRPRIQVVLKSMGKGENVEHSIMPLFIILKWEAEHRNHEEYNKVLYFYFCKVSFGPAGKFSKISLALMIGRDHFQKLSEGMYSHNCDYNSILKIPGPIKINNPPFLQSDNLNFASCTTPAKPHGKPFPLTLLLSLCTIYFHCIRQSLFRPWRSSISCRFQFSRCELIFSSSSPFAYLRMHQWSSCPHSSPRDCYYWRYECYIISKHGIYLISVL